MQAPGTSVDKEAVFATLLEEVLLGDAEAIRFISDIFAAAHVWDDVVDKDSITEEQFQRTFRDLFLSIPTNPFYMRHFTALHPIVLNSMLNWEAANALEISKTERDLRISYVLRSSFIDLIGVTAFLIGGYEHAVAAVLRARRLEHAETFVEYKATIQES